MPEGMMLNPNAGGITRHTACISCPSMSAGSSYSCSQPASPTAYSGPFTKKRMKTCEQSEQVAVFKLFDLPEELVQCILAKLWRSGDKATKQAARLVSKTMRHWCSELVESLAIEYRDLSDLANNRTRRQARCLRLPRAFPNLRYIKICHSRVHDPFEYSSACAAATRSFLLKTADEFHHLEKLKITRWPCPGLSTGHSHLGMTGAEMDVIARKCPNLTTLHVHAAGNALSRLAQLRDLRTLCLMHTTVDEDGMQVLLGVRGLQHLHASAVKLLGGAGTSALGGLTGLKTLQFDATQFNNLAIQAVGQLTALTRLYLGTLSAQVTSPYLASSLACLGSLQDLTLRRSDPAGFCQVDLFRCLGALPALRRLVLHSNLDLEPLTRAAGFTSLESLHLVFAASHSMVLQYLKLDCPWPKLTDLVLGYFQVQDPAMVFKAISKQTQLQSLMVVSMNNKVTDGTLMQLTALQQLNSLKVKLYGNSEMPSPPAVTAVRTALPRLQKFGIDEFKLKIPVA